MTTRIAWKPYMFNQAMPHLIKTVTVPTLVVWGKQNHVVPLSCGERYQQAMPKAKLEISTAPDITLKSKSTANFPASPNRLLCK